MTPSRNWIAVASADHVRRGRREGFMQVCHGKAAPLKRIRSGDRVAYYSPVVTFGKPEKFQGFTAVGRVMDEAVYAFDMGGGFVPYRRNVDWWNCQETLIRPLLGLLDFSRDRPNWGYQLRFGLFEISDGDMDLIAAAMQAVPGEAAASIPERPQMALDLV